MTILDDPMRKHIECIVSTEKRPFSFIDFLTFEVDQQRYKMSHGTFRNKISAMLRREEVEVLVTNHQTQSSVDGPYRVAPLGGYAVSYASNYRIYLDYRDAYRRANLDLGPCPPQDDISFAINERGFTDIAED